MKFEGVTFVEHVVRRMTKEDFIRKHLKVFWKNRTRKERHQMLSDVYDIINK